MNKMSINNDNIISERFEEHEQRLDRVQVQDVFTVQQLVQNQGYLLGTIQSPRVLQVIM